MNTLGKTFDEIGAIYKDNRISDSETGANRENL
jgi:hypothetical protein